METRMNTPKWRREFSSTHDVTTAVGQHLERERVRHRHVFEPVAHGELIIGSNGSAALEAVCRMIESEISDLLAARSGLRFFAGLRQLSPRLWAKSSGNAVEFQDTAMNIGELAVHRYASWEGQIDWRAEAPPHWNSAGARQLARLLVLAEYYGNTLAARRRTGKGQGLRYEARAERYPFVNDESTAGVADLITVLDERNRRNGNFMATYGGYLDLRSDDEATGRIIAADRFDPTDSGAIHALIDQLVRRNPNGGRHQRATPKQRDAARRAVDHATHWGYHPDLRERRAAVAEYDEAMKQQFGFELLDLEFVLDVCTSKVLSAWETFAFLDDYGFELAAAPTTADFELALATSRSYGIDRWPSVTGQTAQSALQFLDAGRHPGELSNPQACRPIRILGDSMLYDGVHVRFPSPLVWDVNFDDRRRDSLARRFESDAHHALSEFGPQPWVSGRRLRVDGRMLTDVDASVVIDDLMVVVDCYNSRWTAQLDIGSFSPTRNRAGDLEAKLEKWDRQWLTVARDHPELLPAGVRRLFPVVATPGPEWIASENDRLWLDDQTPRVCTLSELTTNLRTHGADRRRSDVHVL